MKSVSAAMTVVICLTFAISAFAQCGTCAYEADRIIALMKPQVDKVRAGYQGTLGIHANPNTVANLRNCIAGCFGSERANALSKVQWIEGNLWIYSRQPRVVAH